MILRPSIPLSRLCLLLVSVLGLSISVAGQIPSTPDILRLEELETGTEGEVWTVFQGSEPEPFTVRITGVIHNALGPGKAMILCELIDERVQHMGAVAGMSGSPLYVDGKLAGALSYQVQRFETVRFAGFTPVEDLLEVRQIADRTDVAGSAGDTLPASSSDLQIQPMTPVFAFGGMAPQVQQIMQEPLAELGVRAAALGGSTSGHQMADPASATLGAGQAVAAALAVGDITLAGTGTVSQVDDNHILAFGHPMLGLGEVEMPMMTADIVTILPSNMSSVKISNTGEMIGTIRQDRLSAIYGEIGEWPEMVPVTVNTPTDNLEFSTVRHARLTPMIAAMGLAQAVLGTNEAGMADGFAVTTKVKFADQDVLQTRMLFAGPKAFADSMRGLTNDLTTWLQNPVEESFPEHVEFDVTPLDENPLTSLDNLQLSHRSIAANETLEVELQYRDYQSATHRETIAINVAPDWVDKRVEVVVASGGRLDIMSGGKRTYPVSQIRDLEAYTDIVREQRRPDGIYVAVVTMAEVFTDQTSATTELPGSLARIAQTADEARYQQRRVREVLWETHLLPDRLVPGTISQGFVVTP